MDSYLPKIRIENLIVLYGEKPRVALQMFRDGKTRDSILQATGNVLGVADVSLNIDRGELFVLMGLSGSGKSTLLRCINRLIKPTSGHLYIDDEDIAHVDENRMREIRLTKVSMVFQRFGLLPHKTVVENVEYGLKVRGIDARQRRQKALETLEAVGLGQWTNHLPSSLSGGMQQRVGLARALATDAEILLMDEPFSALDPLIRGQMQDELLRLQRELHKTIVFVSHDIQEALKIGDRIAVMKDGSIVQVGTPEEIVTQPADDYISAFTRDVNYTQFLKAGSIARSTISLILGQESARSALEKMQNNNLDRIYVLDRDRQPIGIIDRQLLAQTIQQGSEDIRTAMQTKFPVVDDSTSLEDIFPLYQQGLSVAVVDAAGKFTGVVEQTDAIASIGKLSQRRLTKDKLVETI